jgi:two-component system LytT family response regulator
MLNAILLDDEAPSRNMLENLLREYCPEINILASCSSIAEAKKALAVHEPDLVFLDVELPEGTSFELLQGLKNVKFEIIFTTAHEKYALQAIRFSALDYLMKPILADELKTAVKRVFQKADTKSRGPQLDALIYNLNYSNADKKLAIPTTNGYEFISISEVVRCEAADNYTYFYLTTGAKILVSKTLMEFERLLSSFYFFRVHQSNLINLRMIKSYQKGEGGVLIMTDDTEVEVSRRKKADLLTAISEFAIFPG